MPITDLVSSPHDHRTGHFTLGETFGDFNHQVGCQELLPSCSTEAGEKIFLEKTIQRMMLDPWLTTDLLESVFSRAHDPDTRLGWNPRVKIR